MTVVVGLDGCRSGWVAVALTDDGSVEVHYLRTVDDLDVAAPDAPVVGVDIPMAFAASGWRAAEIAARAALGRRASSVFLTPRRDVLAAATYAEANALSMELSGRGVSRQAYALAAKVFEVERWSTTTDRTVVEVHPELSFAAMLGAPATHSKKTWAGMVERRDALGREGIRLDGDLGLAGALAAVDDVLDAAAVAWTARRVRDGVAVCHPDPPLSGALAIWS